MQILRHSQIAVTMNVYSEVSSEATREAPQKARRAPNVGRPDDGPGKGVGAADRPHEAVADDG